MVTLDALVVVTALPSMHRDLGGGIGTLQWTVSAYSIAFGAGILTAAALGDRLGRRRGLRGRLGPVHGGVRLLRPGADRRDARGLPGRAGPRRRGRPAARAHPSHLGVPSRAPRRGGGDMGWYRRAGGGRGAARRGVDHRGAELALDLLGERAHRRAGRDRGSVPAARELRAACSARRAGPGPCLRRCGAAHLGPGAGQPKRVGERPERDRARPRRATSARLRRAARPGPHSP